MRLALAQTNPVVGDLDGNAAIVLDLAARAADAGSDLVVFPELCLTGYPPKDLLLQQGFMEAVVAAARRLGESCPKGITVVFGTPLPADSATAPVAGAPARLANSLLAYRDGKLLDYYDKRLLPTYDVFDENRYFVPGRRAVVIDVKGTRVGLSVCEDLWRGEDVGFSHRYESEPDPVEELVAAGAQLIVNPSASPFVLGKGRRHRALLRTHATRHRVYVAAVNQVGGNDELVFDGHAAVIDPAGATIAAGAGFEEGLTIVDLPSPPGFAAPDPLLEAPDEELLYRALVLGVRDYLRKTGFKSAVLGLSGGIDSAVTAVIAAAALDPENVTGVSMPSRFSSEGSVTDARLLAESLGLRTRSVPIEGPVAAFERALADAFRGTQPGVTEENIQARTRGIILMALSNKFGTLLLTTGNKSELAVGYCTLYGDMNGGLAVLSDVSKQWVYRLARWINANPARLRSSGSPPFPSPIAIPPGSISKPPSAELRPNQTDQDSLPPYEVLDEIIERSVEKRQSPETIVRETGFDPATVSRIVRLIDVNEYKRKQAAVGLKVTGVAFGSGRRYPIAQGWRPDRMGTI